MKLSDYAAALALENGGFLMSGDASAALHVGDIIEITSRAGLSVTGVRVMPLVDAPHAMVMSSARRTAQGWSPFFSPVVYDTAYQAAYAQLMENAGRGFDVDDVLDWQVLEEPVTVVSVKQVANYAHK